MSVSDKRIVDGALYVLLSAPHLKGVLPFVASRREGQWSDYYTGIPLAPDDSFAALAVAPILEVKTEGDKRIGQPA